MNSKVSEMESKRQKTAGSKFRVRLAILQYLEPFRDQKSQNVASDDIGRSIST